MTKLCTIKKLSIFTIIFFSFNSFSLSAMETSINEENASLNAPSHDPAVLCRIKALKGILWTSTLVSSVYAFWGFGKAMSSNDRDFDGYQKYFIGTPSILLNFFALFTLYNMKNT